MELSSDPRNLPQVSVRREAPGPVGLLLTGTLLFCSGGDVRPTQLAWAIGAGDPTGRSDPFTQLRAHLLPAPRGASSSQPSSGPAGTPAARRVDAGSFTLLTYNVAGLPNIISPSYPATNTPIISPLLNHYDVAMVQEDFYYHAELIGQARHDFRSEHRSGFGLPSDGLGVLSRFALGGARHVPWTDCNGYLQDYSDCLADKGFYFSEITLAPGVELHAYNVHAEAGRSAADERVRRANFEQLAAYIQENSAGQAILVAGDTNLYLSSAEDRKTFARFMANSELEDACGEHSAREDEIDRVLFRGSAQTRLSASGWRRDTRFVDRDGRALSDHPAIGVELTWQRLPPAAVARRRHAAAEPLPRAELGPSRRLVGD